MKKIFIFLAMLTAACSKSSTPADTFLPCQRPLGQKIAIVNFKYRKTDIPLSAQKKIISLAKTYAKSSKVCIIAHPTDEGSEYDNKLLYQQRSYKLANILMETGVKKSKITTDYLLFPPEGIAFRPVRPIDEERKIEVWFTD